MLIFGSGVSFQLASQKNEWRKLPACESKTGLPIADATVAMENSL